MTSSTPRSARLADDGPCGHCGGQLARLGGYLIHEASRSAVCADGTTLATLADPAPKAEDVAERWRASYGLPDPEAAVCECCHEASTYHYGLCAWCIEACGPTHVAWTPEADAR